MNITIHTIMSQKHVREKQKNNYEQLATSVDDENKINF